ncbi:LOW QUALITY PROTEIN: bromodomain adjacent to zinc finger domain protein 2A [Chelonia mydas]|uniref:LOW QUALITY PROTEIN: bromodomain adjacent to zinc finger domain protein 2A n=1 Tax=Chelonia mydas TaxID=8469 RepID=UPI001CA8C69E|nr:LOW QUALITY PROTEIN: bromodomain adjacent to zinc finger domain protein 2A [Chelonia mydas]
MTSRGLILSPAQVWGGLLAGWEMETNNHFNFPGLPSVPTASGLKPAPSSGDSPYTNGSPINFPPQGKGLNGDMNGNGLSTVSHTSTSGTFASAGHSLDASALPHPYDYLWNYPPYQPGGLKETPGVSQFSGLGQYPLNGILGGARPSSPGHNTNPRGGQEFWANGTSGSMGLSFDSQELYDSFQDHSFELVPNGASGFYAASQPSPMLGTGPEGSLAAKEMPPAGEETGAALMGSKELEETQPDLQICSYNRSGTGVEPLSQEASVLSPGTAGSCLGDTSVIAGPLADPPLLSEDPLEPFESLARDPGTGDLYEMDNSQLVNDKSSLEAAPDISTLDCSESPSLNNSSSFSLLPDDSQAPSSLFVSPVSPPVLGEAVLQDSSLDLQDGGDPGEEDSESLERSPPLEPESPAACLEQEEEEEEEVAEDSCLEAPAAPLSASARGEVPRRRIATVEEVRFPLQHGWRREVRIKKGSHRWQGETWYYGPCGKRMKQFPEVIKYLSRNVVQDVRREHFSFSPRMPVGDFYEERDTPEGLQWVKLTQEEIPSRIQAITGKRGRPRNAEKEKAKAKEAPKVKRGRGRPPKAKMADLLSKTDARLLKKLEAQEVLSDEEKLKMSKIKKKMRRKARNKQKQEAKVPKPKEAKKKAKAKKEKARPEKPKEKARPKEKGRPKEKAKAVRKVDKNLLAQRRLEERRRQQMILEEMKKPTEDMCLGDHQPLPAFSRIPGLVLPSGAFSDCLTIVEFLHCYGRVLGFEVPRDVPSLCTLQEGLFGVDDSLGEVQDLLVRLLQAALYDPGLPSYCQSLKILGEKVSEISLNRDTVSEILRCFLMAYGADADLCHGLRTKPFQALPPDRKAAILAFLVNELNGSALIINEIDKTLENMSNYRRNKWIIEGKLRRLKIALAKKTGRPEPEITGLDEGPRRRSSRLPEETRGLEAEEEESRGRKSRKDEEANIPAASVPELERQIEKLAKRQMFFRKKLLHASQTLRAAALGQDRYRRRYWVLPHLGGIFVEGSEAATEEGPKDTEQEEEKEAAPEISPVKKEPVTVPIPARPNCPASRARGRPRKSKEEPARPGGPKPPPLNGLLEDSMPPCQSQHDLSQSAFLSWLSQTQSSLLNGSVLTPDSSPGKGDPSPPAPEVPALEESFPETAEKRGPWFNLLPRTPCHAAAPLATSEEEPPSRAAPQPHSLHPGDQPKAMGRQPNGPASPPLASTPVHASPRVPSTCPRGRGGPENAQEPPGQPKRRGRPPTKFFKQIEQKYLTQLMAQPVPPEMQSGWWWLKDPEELEAMARALHPRGIREKALHKHLTKHKEYLREVCTRTTADPIFQPQAAGPPVSQEALARWSVTERAYEMDLALLQWVEELEQRVLMADLQIRGWTCPSPDSARDDLQYCEHKVGALEDITLKNRREGLPPRREATNPLDLAVLRLAALEQNMERRYLKEPLWPPHEVVVEKAVLSSPEALDLGSTEIAYEITPRMRTWRQTLERCRSAAQVSLCIYQLEKSIAWEKSVNKVTCLVCRKGDDDEHLLLCDGCDRGCHLYCHRPRMTEVPDGDWFCSVCVSQAGGEYYDDPSSPRRGKKRKGGRLFGGGFPEEEESPGRRVLPRRRDTLSVPRYSGEGLSPSKRRRLSPRGQSSDLTFCEIILMEMESQEDAWPFLEPVNPRLVPGYRKIIKNPMDFATMRTRLLRGEYVSCEEFAADATRVFDNCQTFNEDDSEVGKAGRAMRSFFESRWEEFYQGKHAPNP